jgi:hypothetical protein
VPKNKKSNSKGGMARVYKGLNKARYTQKGGSGNRVMMKESQTVPLQFLTDPSGFVEYDEHQFKVGGQFSYVPCIGDDCPLCDDEDRDISKSRYTMLANVYNLKEKKVQILKGGKDLAGKIMLRFERAEKKKPGTFLKRVFDITPMPGAFRTYDVAVAEEDPVKIANLTAFDLEEEVEKSIKEYYGDNLPDGSSKSSLDSDDDDDDDDEDEDEKSVHTEAELKKLKIKDLRAIADELDIDHEDVAKADLIAAILEEQDEGEDDDDDDEDEDDDESDDDDDDSDDDEDEDDDDEDEDDEDEKPSKPAKKAAKTAKAAKKGGKK